MTCPFSPPHDFARLIAQRAPIRLTPRHCFGAGTGCAGAGAISALLALRHPLSQMTFAPSRPCKSPGCSALIAAGQGAWCPAHTSTSTSHLNRRSSDRARGSAASRGYDHRWQEARLGFLSRYPLCAGVLIATEHWTRDLAQQFHALREQAREKGNLLILHHEGTKARSSDSAPSASSALIFLEQFPIYRIEPWQVGQPATVVDHIIPHKGDPELLWAEWNWQPLDKRAHDKKTAREAKQRIVSV
jgi:hypothetical protein